MSYICDFVYFFLSFYLLAIKFGHDHKSAKIELLLLILGTCMLL